MRVYFMDEAPEIGCGWRQVEVQKGRKWVRVKDPRTGAVRKFLAVDWAIIERTVVLQPVGEGRLRKDGTRGQPRRRT
jgi:hypothetical protein